MMLLQVALFLLAWGFVQKSQSSKNEVNDFRLPDHIQPEHYFLLLEPNFENHTFRGIVTLQFTVVKQTQNITLHAYQLEIDESNIHLDDSAITLSNSSQSGGDDNFFVIHFNSTLKLGNKYRLTISNFRGILNSDMLGFYLVKYVDENEREWYEKVCCFFQKLLLIIIFYVGNLPLLSFKI